MSVLHSCDTPACWNPDHLFLGTQADNVHDCIQKGRAVFPPSPAGVPKSEIHRRRLAIARLGSRASDETRAKMAESQTGRKMSPEAVAKTAAAHRGRKRSDETRRRLREAWARRKLMDVPRGT